MQKILNDPVAFVDDTLDGIIAAHPDQLRRPAPRVIARAAAPDPARVAIVTGGGSGHLPVFLGYVGTGLVDAAAVGNVFASPSSDDMMAAIRAVAGPAGTMLLYGNYGGDILNFDMAAELLGAEGFEIRSILAADDVASAPPDRAERRRGIAGIFFLYKIAGAAAVAAGRSLDEVVAVTERAAAGLRTMGVALSPCIIPAAGRPTFELADGEMEIGMGIHGEPGVRRGRLGTAREIAAELTAAILTDLPYRSGDRVAVLVNGLGATPREELYILYREVAPLLAGAGLTVHRVDVGEFATSLEMAGASISLLRLDDELATLLDAPAASPFFIRT